MSNWIQKVREPRKLLLAWQAADQVGTRYRWAVGSLELCRDDDSYSLRYMRPGVEFERLNPGHTFDELLDLGYEGFPGFKLGTDLHKAGVREAFMGRLPPRNRPDFDEYLRQFRLPAAIDISDFSLLAHTEAKLPSDGFSLVDQLDANEEACDLMLEVAGYRHYVTETGAPFGASLGDAVDILPEPENPHDSGAVQIQINGHLIGYINRLQAPALLDWMRSRSVSSVLERVNGRPGRPRAFAFIQVRPVEGRRAA